MNKLEWTADKMLIIESLENAHREGVAAHMAGESFQSCIYLKMMKQNGIDRILRLKNLMWCNGWGQSYALSQENNTNA